MTGRHPVRRAAATVLVSLLYVLNYEPAAATAVISSPVSAVKAYPNPWRADKHMNLPIKFEGMPASSVVKIFTVSGHEVQSFTADSQGQARWDRTNSGGDRVASGIYIYLVIDPQGNDTSGKLAIIQ